MITELSKKFPNLEVIDVRTDAARGYSTVVITLKDQTTIYVRSNPEGVSVNIWEDNICLWHTQVKSRGKT